ncbi:MAG: dihydroorotase [Bdellovibrionaceae bacterium]|nr:dihydroorotase [Pseudobdellovibrionaceae bacterium]
MYDLIIKQARCLLPHPKNTNQVLEEELDIAIQEGKIKQIGGLYKAKSKAEFSAKGLYVLPGLIDTQVHFREPGLEHKEDIYHGSLSAIKGGITAFFEMPNTSPPTAQISDLEEKVKRAEKNSWCDFAFYLGAVKENKKILADIENSPACPGVKLFLGSSTGNLTLEDDESLRAVFSNRKRITAVHSEDETRLQERKALRYIEPAHARNHPIWRDEEVCLLSTKRVVDLARKHQAPIHILHVTTKQEMEFLAQHKDIASVEVTPQHLTLFAPDCYDNYGSFAQMNPPIREKTHQLALWKALQSGVVDMIGSDHAPHTKEEKLQKYPNSPSGMPGVQTLLPLMLDHINKARLDLKLLVKLLAHKPAERFQLKNQGQIKEGFKAHFTIIDLKAKRKIQTNWLASKCGWSPFENWQVQGWPIFTFLYGKKVMAEDEVLGQPSGQKIEFSDT